jgi:F-type H+-transporting ATPase subunit gamma
MQSIERLKKKIKTAQDLLSVVRTMKSLAAVNIRQFEDAVGAVQEYSSIVDLGWQVLFKSVGKLAPIKTWQGIILLILGSDQGMCGKFNEVVLDLALQKEKELAERKEKILFWTTGQRIRPGLVYEGKTVQEHFDLPSDLAGINDQVYLIVKTFEAWQREKRVEGLNILYNQLDKGGSYHPVCFQLLPLDKSWLEKYRLKTWPNRCLPLSGLPGDDLFRHLFRQYLFVALFRSFAQSLASENAARLMSMQAAEKNIQELKEDLQSEFRETRQSIITAELLDIIAGFEAISNDQG